MRVKETTKLFLIDTMWILLTVGLLILLTGLAYLTLSGQGYNPNTIQWIILLITSVVAAPSVYLLKRGTNLPWTGISNQEEEGAKTISIPVLGSIVRGQRIPIPDHDLSTDGHGSVQVTRDMCKDSYGVYALRVKDALIDALINHGDIVIINQEQPIRDGDMVVAWLKSEETTTLKLFYQEEDKVKLQPANPTMAPIHVNSDDIEIQGKVIAVIRQIGSTHPSLAEEDFQKTYERARI